MIKINLKITNFLDITRDLEKGTFEPFKKEDTFIYIHISSNHPLSIIKQIPISIRCRLSETHLTLAYLTVKRASLVV